MNLRSGKVKHSGETRKRQEKMNNNENNQEIGPYGNFFSTCYTLHFL